VWYYRGSLLRNVVRMLVALKEQRRRGMFEHRVLRTTCVLRREALAWGCRRTA
jgi:hypothetical protein